MASSVAGLLEAAVSPQSYADGWRYVNDRAYQTILREFESGAAGPWAFAQGLSTTAGDVFGYNSVFEAAFGIDRGSLAQLGAAERWTRGFAGLSQIAGSIAGGLRLYNPRIGGPRLGAAGLADAPSVVLLTPETKLCLKPSLRDPGLRPRVLAALEESKLAGQASRFEEFAARTQTATQLGFDFVGELPPLTGSSAGYGVSLFDQRIAGYLNTPTATLGRSGSSHFFMPLEDAAGIRNATDAARASGMAPSVVRAYTSEQPVFGVVFPTEGISVRTPTPADANGWAHFLEGGRTAVRTEGSGGGYLLNTTREFVTSGGAAMPSGSILFQIGEQGEWIMIRRY